MILWTVMNLSNGGVPRGCESDRLSIVLDTDRSRAELEARSLNGFYHGSDYRVYAVVPDDEGYRITIDQ